MTNIEISSVTDGARWAYALYDARDWTRYHFSLSPFSSSEMIWLKSEAEMAERVKSPPAKDWDEQITPEDTKELDEFLNTLVRKGAPESAP